jgi:LuxR family maltose regulon positive regulatory protein
VSRRRLLDRLETGLRRKLILVSAPAGYGKTTLLSEWHAASQGGTLALAWVLLDEQDNDPVRFWSYVFAAFEKVRPGSSKGAGAMLRGLRRLGAAPGHDRSGSMQAVLAALVNDLVRAQEGDVPERPLVLVLDDYHTVQNPEIHGTLTFLLDYLPAAIHIVILTRADPPLPLARLRARDQLLELRVPDLRFTAEEVNLFLNRAMALDLPAAAVSALDARTQGWAAGLQLAALSLQGLDRKQAQRFIEAFEGSHRHVLTYLTEEVLQRQPPEEQAFLLQTSILPYLTAPLCDVVMGQPGSQAMLERLANDNLFTTPLDDEGRWYRYHPLFADTLRTRLQQSSPDLLPELHRRASAWHQGQGALADAVRHALAAEEPEIAAHLVEGGYKRLVMRGELVTLHRWLDALPAGLVETRPRLCLAYAFALAYSGRRESVEAYLQQAERALAATSDTAAGDSIRGEIAACRAVLASVNWAGACSLDLARHALALLPAAHSEDELWLRVMILQALANCYRFQGEVREADDVYVEALAASRALDSPFLVQAVTNRRGQNQILQGRLRQAAQTFEGALRQAEDRGGELLWFSGELHAHLGQIYAEWNELDRALQHVQQGIDLSRLAENHLAVLEGYLALAGVQAAQRRAEAASLALDQAQQLAAAAGVPYLSSQVAAQRAWLSMADDSSHVLNAQVRQWAETWISQRAQETDEDQPVILREFEDLIVARFWLRLGQLDEALELLAEIETAAQEAGRFGALLQTLLLRALIYRQRDEPDQAKEILWRALALGEPEGYMRTFLDMGPPLRSMLSDLRSTPPASAGASASAGITSSRGALSELLPYADRLLAAFAGSGWPGSGAKHLLTPRELEILALMAAGASNQEIAVQLVVTSGTVKGHVNHILDKLDVHNRTGAVARARELGLLDP